jgi:hypothetical protein
MESVNNFRNLVVSWHFFLCHCNSKYMHLSLSLTLCLRQSLSLFIRLLVLDLRIANFSAGQNEQYPGFARAHAPYYWLDSTQLNFRDRTRPTPVCLGKVPWAFGSVVERVVRNERESSRSWDRSPQCPQVFAIVLRFFCLRTLMPISSWCQNRDASFFL